jgi:hypothetical protein
MATLPTPVSASAPRRRVHPADGLLAGAPLVVFLLLWVFVRADPAAGVTFSKGLRNNNVGELVTR